MKKKLIVMLLTVCMAVSAFALTACKKPTITLNKTTLEMAIGESFTLEATVSEEVEVTWSSSNSDVAKVNSYGVVVAMKLGEATITASAKGAKATCKVKVVPVAILNKTEITLLSGDEDEVPEKYNQFQLTATFNPTLPAGQKATWSSSDTAVATVDDTGLVKAVAPGKAIITVTAPNGAKASAEVTVEALNTDPAVVTFTVIVPEELPEYVNVYIIGNNTGAWTTLSDDNKLTRDATDKRKYTGTITFDFEADDTLSREMEYKYVLGNKNGAVNWGFVEKGPSGEELSNRTLFLNGGTHSVNDTVANWAGIPGDPNISITVDITITLHIPEATENEIYLVGAFPEPYLSWQTDENLKLTKETDTIYTWSGQITTSPMALEFKFYNGSWGAGNELVFSEDELPSGVTLNGTNLRIVLEESGELNIVLTSAGWLEE